MSNYKVIYIGIGGIERCTTIEAYTPYEAREEFERTYWAYHEVISVEEVGKD